MLAQLLLIQLDTHRHTLHHLDPVTGGVLRRQQAEGATRTGAQANHFAVVFHLATVYIGRNLRGLIDTDIAQFGFLEVGVHPQLVQRHNRQQGLARGDARAHLHATLGHIARHRRRDGIALHGQPRLRVIGASTQHAGVICDVDAIDAGMGGFGLLFGYIQRRFGDGDIVFGVGNFFGRHGVVSGQRRTARQIILRLGRSIRFCASAASYCEALA